MIMVDPQRKILYTPIHPSIHASARHSRGVVSGGGVGYASGGCT